MTHCFMEVELLIHLLLFGNVNPTMTLICSLFFMTDRPNAAHDLLEASGVMHQFTLWSFTKYIFAI